MNSRYWNAARDVTGNGQFMIFPPITEAPPADLIFSGSHKQGMWASLVLYMDLDGIYHFLKDRSGGGYLGTLIEMGLVDSSQVRRCCTEVRSRFSAPLSEEAILVLSLMLDQRSPRWMPR